MRFQSYVESFLTKGLSMAEKGMNSTKLAARSRQPGHDQDWKDSETDFIKVAKQALDADKYEVIPKPDDLRDLFPKKKGDKRDLGIVPEALIRNKITGKKFFVEVKRQKDGGNAEERACKHLTVQFYKTMHEKFGYDFHPYVTIMCDALAKKPIYVRKHPFYFEKNQYFNWVDYEPSILESYLKARCAEWLDH